jgi:hypothetical protein
MVKKDPNLLSNVKDLQKQWGDMNVNDKAEVHCTCRSFWKLIQPGASDDFETDWEFKAQDFFMKGFNCKYRVEDDTQNKRKGCKAMSGNVSLRACHKILFFKATNGGHSYFLSPNAQGVRGSRKIGKVSWKKDHKFRSMYYRQTQSNIQGREMLANKNKKQNKTMNQTEDDYKDNLDEENDASIVKSKGSKRSVAGRRKAKEPRQIVQQHSKTRVVECVTNPILFYLQSKVVSDLRKEKQKLQKKVQMEAQAKARNRADQQEGMIQILQKKTAAPNNVRKSVSTGKLVGKTGQREVSSDGEDEGSSNEEGSDNSEDNKIAHGNTSFVDDNDEDNKIAHGSTSFVDGDDEEEVDKDPVVKDFCWKSVARKSGYLIVRFDDEETDQQMELKPLLHHYPELVIRFMWEKYSQSEQTMHYVEQCAKV